MAIVNYSFQKNIKEQARKKKQEEKRLAKLNKKMAKQQESSSPAVNQEGGLRLLSVNPRFWAGIV